MVNPGPMLSDVVFVRGKFFNFMISLSNEMNRCALFLSRGLNFSKHSNNKQFVGVVSKTSRGALANIDILFECNRSMMFL